MPTAENTHKFENKKIKIIPDYTLKTKLKPHGYAELFRRFDTLLFHKRKHLDEHKKEGVIAVHYSVIYNEA